MQIEFNLKNNVKIMLRTDEHNYELCRLGYRRDKKTGNVEPEWVAFKWFASLDQALNRLIDMKIRVSDARTLKQLAVDLAAAREEVTSVWATSTKIAA